MSLQPGSFLGPYEIDSLIGAGGMGEVYRARDTRLNRRVAIKVLPEARASDTEFRTRFEREARAIAALNHPHICTVHDVGHHDGRDYLVMELVEGITLAARLERQPLELDEAVNYAIQIADALDRAHRAGIVHRDLKPGNVMVTKTGVKLVDFGLAKSSPPAAELDAQATSPGDVTAPGALLGTLQYMAPEQVQRKEADARTDIFAFGAILYEMVAGRKAFESTTEAGLMLAILRDQPPPIQTLQPLAPRALVRVVETCLAKDPVDRWQSARDLRRELQWIKEEPVASAGSAPAIYVHDKPARRLWLWVSLVGAAALTGAALGWFTRPSPSSATVVRWMFPTTAVGASGRVALSRDGQAIVYDGLRSDGVQQLYARRLDQLEPVPIRGTDGASQVALSPDATWVLFVAGRKLMKVPFSGGPVAILGDVPAIVLGLSWGLRDEIVFGSTEGLYRVPAAGGSPTQITHLDPARKETAHGWPILLDDGRTVVFVMSRATVPEIAVTTREGESPRALVRGTHPRITAGGDLLFTRGSTVWATKYDATFNRVLREPVPVLEGVSALLSGYTPFDVAPNGTAIYRPRRAETHQLSWVDRNGRTSPAIAERYDGIYHGPPALSPDGKQLAISRHPTNGVDQIVMYDLQRSLQTPLTDVSGTSRWPVWMPDGSRLTFASERQGSWDIYDVAASGAGAAQPLLVAPRDQLPWSWSPDGRTLGYVNGQVNSFDIWFLPRVGGEPYPLARAETSRVPLPKLETSVAFSPDGKWIVYQSDESGRMEVYLHPFPGPGNTLRVSPDGGQYPLWSRDGREILYVAGGDTVVSVAVRFTTEPVISQPAQLFHIQFGNDGSRPYDVAADGRLIAIQDLNTTPASIAVVEHWTQELDRLLAKH